MGLLTPLYLAGLAALSLPVVLHLIRRTPRGRQAFSSLMFLTPSPPRLTRRSRLDHLLLLVLRLTALALLAFAFARPFLRETAVLPLGEPPGRRVAILLDTSASMRGGTLWPEAVREVEKVLAELGPADDVSLITFDDSRHTVVEFSDEGDSPRGKADLVRRRMRALTPSWHATDLGAALVAVAAELEVQTDVEHAAVEPQLIVVSDFAQGSKTQALQSWSWPEKVPVTLRAVSSGPATNAGLQFLLDTGRATQEPRVRVTNAANSAGDQFSVRWQGKQRADKVTPLATYVPAGQSRVLRLPRPEAEPEADRIVLEGDDADFDNVFYVVPPRRREMTVAWLGDDDPLNAESDRYFFELAVSDDALRHVEVRPAKTAGELAPAGGERPEMIVATFPLTPELADALKDYVQGGGVVVALTSSVAESVTRLLDDVELSGTAEREKQDGAAAGDKRSYRMLGEIDFTHPLFAALADPRYSDFTKIHFWRHQTLRLKDAAAIRVLARFDNGDPAILERSLGKGRVIVFASGWQPEESQLALSSKFVPLVQALVDMAAGGDGPAPALAIGDPLWLPKPPREPAIVAKPDGRRVSLAADAMTFTDTQLPGIYRLYLGEEERPFAVNVAAGESNTAPMDLENLEQLGVRLSSPLTHAQRVEQVRQQRDTELESRQRLWRWLVVEAMLLLLLETWLSGRAARKLRNSDIA